MGCLQCERKHNAAFYNRFVGKVGPASITMLMATAFFAGLRPSNGGLRVTWENDILTVAAPARNISVCVLKGSCNVTLNYQGKTYQLSVPEHAGFIVQGKEVPE
jgi:hypothetical protein